MATYKVIQDVEAEDKLVGPLTLRQFIYAGIAAFCIYLTYFVVAKGAAFMAVFLVPPAMIMAFFAFPWGKEQPTEVWALARIRFMFKPKRRIWDQSGIQELVTITVPKRIERVYSDGLSQQEVRSRLQALATTIDSRGWAIKNSAVNPYMTPAFAATDASADRLIDMSTVPQDIPAYKQEVYTDMLDPANNRVADQFSNMLSANEQEHRARLVASMQQSDDTQPQNSQNNKSNNSGSQRPDYWFLNQSGTTQDNTGGPVIAPGASTDPVPAAHISKDEEEALVEELKAHSEENKHTAVYSHLPTILPLSEQERIAKESAAKSKLQADSQPAPFQQAPAVTEEPDIAILDLSRNDDLNIETLARQAKKAHGDDEVVISLH